MGWALPATWVEEEETVLFINAQLPSFFMCDCEHDAAVFM
jgi:hypothetical protein